MLLASIAANGTNSNTLDTTILADYVDQGDMSMYTVEKLAERRAAARDPRLHHAIKVLIAHFNI